ncbi:beta-Ala-His dipeptidase [uncultured Succinatimonas sp.]|uniref:beta-Ala-His dipeptidase n=1 Tax=uncultured Succinatimonas sp. TaxID=1262973 RepID=UPI0025F985F8|nr:beta-Ala-His dipeptidase [uncultured Succinatimonas sp.]
MTDILNLEPKAIWSHFADFCAIPHPSGHEQRIAEYLCKFAEKNGLECKIEECGNVIIKKAASKGYENKETVILQAHIDMVPVADSGIKHDFLKDPIIPVVKDDGFVYAKGTTLGADDGIGACTALAILEDKELNHGPLIAVFTVEEESTMKGALQIAPEVLQEGKYLINLDSEDDDFLFVSCAGSADINLKFASKRIEIEDTKAFTVSLSGLKGGHSGTDINKGRANAAEVLSAILLNVSDDSCDLFLADFTSGHVRNSIPSTAKVTVKVPSGRVDAFVKAVKESFSFYRDFYKSTDPDMTLCVNETDCAKAFGLTDTQTFLSLIRALPLGPTRPWDINPEIVETSVNLGLVSSDDSGLCLCLMPRSLKESGLDDIIAKLSAFCSLIDNLEIEIDNRHPCWESPSENSLISCLKKNYKEITGKDMIVTALHAGLECAMFAAKAPNLQLVSLGATINSPHSPFERVSIQGTKNVYEAVKRTLSQL